MSDVRTGMIIAGKYRIEEPLARGGMGSIWRARHLALETGVAIKFISAEVFALAEARRRFQREARVAALLQSPHVVQVSDYGVEGEIPYLVMELLHGEDLGERLKRKPQLTVDETVSIVIQVARALRRAAEAGIVHRDLKPSNVFILHGDEDEELVKVLDFGIAKMPPLLVDDDFTKTGAIIGSPRYMSPEQARGSRLVDPRSDLWSLAVIAYRALTGQLPFQSMDMLDLIEKICTETPIPPSKIEPSLHPDIDAFFVRALCRDPAGRFQTARELAAMFAISCGQPPPSVTSARLKLSSLLGVIQPTPAPEAMVAAEPFGREEPVPPSASPPISSTSTRAATEEETAVEPAVPSTRAPISSSGTTNPRSLTPSASTPPCEPTHISGRPPPASGRDSTTAPYARRITPVPKGTPTPCPSDVDVVCDEATRPWRTLSLRMAFGAGLALLLAGGLALRTWALRADANVTLGDVPRTSAVADSASVPLSDAPRGTPLLSAPPLPVLSARPATAPEGTVTGAPESSTPLPPRPAPPAREHRLRKRNPVLGI
jgi:eukaryotic-like serine/threonine-protein kinase